MQPVRLVCEVVTLRDLVTVPETERVSVGETDTDVVGSPDERTVDLALGDTETERVLVLRKLVGMELGDFVKLRDLDCVMEIVAEGLAAPDERRDALELGDTVTERVLVL